MPCTACCAFQETKTSLFLYFCIWFATLITEYIRVSILFYLFINSGCRNFSTNYDFSIDDGIEILPLIGDSTILNENMNGLDIDVSYKHPLNQDTKIEFGYDGRLNNNNETMDFQLTDSNNNTFLGVNTFRYKRDIHSFFIELVYLTLLCTNIRLEKYLRREAKKIQKREFIIQFSIKILK